MAALRISRWAFVLSPLLAIVQAQTKPDIADAWDRLLENTAIAPVVSRERPAPVQGADFFNHFFLESRSEYIRQQIGFSGQPSITGLLDLLPGSFPGPFQPAANTVSESLSFGTRGWLSPRISSDFSVRYRQDLTRVDSGSPALSILETYPGSRQTEVTEAAMTVSGLAGDGIFAGTHLRVGRQYVWGAELAAFDGASFGIERERYSLNFFGGRRFTYFGDPLQRALGGASLSVKLGENASVGYDSLFYIRGSHALSFRRRLGATWQFQSGLRFVGSAPVEYSAQGMHQSADGKTVARVSFLQKLSNKDYFYDYTGAATDRDPANSVTRLYLGPLSPYTQVSVDARRAISRRFSAGGALWIRRLNDSRDQGPFETSFEDYRGFGGTSFKWFQLDMEFHQRNSDRLSPLGATTFDDTSRTGETRVQDFTAEVRHAFAEGRLSLNGGGFYRRLRFQDRFQGMQDGHDKGLLGGASWRMDARTRLYFDYSLDTDFFLFRPSLSHAQVFRMGLGWKY